MTAVHSITASVHDGAAEAVTDSASGHCSRIPSRTLHRSRGVAAAATDTSGKT